MLDILGAVLSIAILTSLVLTFPASSVTVILVWATFPDPAVSLIVVALSTLKLPTPVVALLIFRAAIGLS